jgi:hypothetical protein
MELYVALLYDRHTDEEIHLFTERQVAIDYARQWARASRSFDEEDFEEREDEDGGYSATYSCEGDWVRVERVVVDAEVGK